MKKLNCFVGFFAVAMTSSAEADRSVRTGELQAGHKLCATMYEHSGFSGHAFQTGHGYYDTSLYNVVYYDRIWRGSLWGHETEVGDFEDRISSIRVAAGCSLWAWEHPSEQGTMWHISEGDHEFSQPWNDVISSAKCSCEAQSGRVPDHLEPFKPPLIPAGLPGWTIPY